jgi:hypothetical protein
MKKLLPILLLFFCLKSSAQTYLPTLQEGATWSIMTEDASTPYIARSTTQYKIIGDTTINNIVYKKLHWLDTDGTSSLAFYLFRESGGKVYFRYFDQFPSGNAYDYLSFQMDMEYLLYDYTLSVGDTIPSTYLTGAYQNQGTVYTISSIGNVLIGGQYHKEFQINGNYSSCEHEVIIEGIGSTRGLIYPSNIYCPSYNFALLCYDLDTIHYTTTYSYLHYGSSCSINNVGIEELGVNPITIYPNPTDNYVTVNLPINYTSGILQIIDLQGRVVKTETLSSKSQTLATGNLPGGVYQVIIGSKNSILGRQKLVVVH